MNHNILKLDSTRCYLLVESNVYTNEQVMEQVPVYDREGVPKGEPGKLTDKMETSFNGGYKVRISGKNKTWHDTNAKFVEEGMIKVGDVFLDGKVVKIASYQDYINYEQPEFWEDPKYSEASSETEHRGYIRKVHSTKMQGEAFDMWYVPEVKNSINGKKSELATLVKQDLN